MGDHGPAIASWSAPGGVPAPPWPAGPARRLSASLLGALPVDWGWFPNTGKREMFISLAVTFAFVGPMGLTTWAKLRRPDGNGLA
jgi:hypothetical protein